MLIPRTALARYLDPSHVGADAAAPRGRSRRDNADFSAARSPGPSKTKRRTRARRSLACTSRTPTPSPPRPRRADRTDPSMRTQYYVHLSRRARRKELAERVLDETHVMKHRGVRGRRVEGEDRLDDGRVLEVRPRGSSLGAKLRAPKRRQPPPQTGREVGQDFVVRARGRFGCGTRHSRPHSRRGRL